MLPSALDGSRPLSLYLHVPFCAAKCDYCAFYSVPRSSVSDDAIDRYMRIILSEIHALTEEWRKPFHTIFIGGGNPGMLGYDRLRLLLKAATANGMARECTIELNPESVTEEIESLRPFLTRVSVGIQSLDGSALRMLGRNASLEGNIKALEILSSTSLDFNADIMTAIPGMDTESTLRDIRQIDSYGPDHISLYCLTFEEGTPLVSRAVPIGEEVEAEALSASWKLLHELGYRHYEVSNFAKGGKECLHNKLYWELGQYIGFGPTAESSVGYRTVVSMRENEDIQSYLSKPELTCYELTAEETEEEYLLTVLRTDTGISKREYKTRFGKDFDTVYGDRIRRLRSGDYVDGEESFSVTEEGFLALDRIILEMVMAL